MELQRTCATREARRPRRTRLLVTVATTAAATCLALVAPAAASVTPTAPVTTLLSVGGAGPAALADVAAQVRALGGSVEATYEVAGALLATLPGSAVPRGAVAVPDTRVSFTALARGATTDVAGATYRSTIGATSAATGLGVTVALVDTGVAAGVPDLDGRVTHVNVSGDATGDGLGHGTFLAGLIAGDGSASAGVYTGVAPQVSLLDVQVAAADGSTSLSRVLAGLQAVAERGDVDVVSLALSTGSPLPPALDPLTRALDTLWARGMTVVVAAGNDGPANNTVGSPGNDPLLLTVGSVDEAGTSARRDDRIADFSSRGNQFGVAKPEVAAPGVSLVSLRAPGSIADVENPQSVVAESYFHGTGTSMSTAVSAGAAAALLSARPGLTPAQVKALLSGTAYRVRGNGAGGLDLAAALAAPTPRAADTEARGERAFSPDGHDAAAWAAFAAAWRDGDLDGVRAAWVELSVQSRRWAASAWAMAVVAQASMLPQELFDSFVAQSRRWATDAWASRRWADDEWASRRWASQDWASRRWAFADWASRRWAAEDWTSRRWADEDWAAGAWDSRRWATEDWLAFAWTSRRWASIDWATAAWAAQAWSSRRWAATDWTTYSFDSRRWATEVWNSRRWAGMT